MRQVIHCSLLEGPSLIQQVLEDGSTIDITLTPEEIGIIEGFIEELNAHYPDNNLWYAISETPDTSEVFNIYAPTIDASTRDIDVGVFCTFDELFPATQIGLPEVIESVYARKGLTDTSLVTYWKSDIIQYAAAECSVSITALVEAPTNEIESIDLTFTIAGNVGKPAPSVSSLSLAKTGNSIFTFTPLDFTGGIAGAVGVVYEVDLEFKDINGIVIDTSTTLLEVISY